MTSVGDPSHGPLQRWLRERLSNRLALAASAITVLALATGLAASLLSSIESARTYVAAELALRVDSAGRQIAAVLDEIERGTHGVAESSFASDALSDRSLLEGVLLPFLAEHRLVRHFAVELRICDPAGAAVATARPGHTEVHALHSPARPGCVEFPDYATLVSAQRPAARIFGAADARAHLQLLVPVPGQRGAVLVDLLPETALTRLPAGGRATSMALTSPQGPIGGAALATDAHLVVVDAPLVLPSASAMAPLGLGVRVGIEGQLARVPWEKLTAAYLAGMVLLGALAFLVTRRLTEKLLGPLTELERVAAHAAGGEAVELGVELQGNDDVGRLAATVKTMGDTLQRTNAALATQVQELTAARNAAQQASVAKTEFLATMSHEIRTPMNAILGLSYLALQSPLDGKARGYIEKTHDAADSLLGILNGILDFSKVEAGHMHLEREPFVLRQVVSRVVGTAGVKAAAKGLELRVEIEDRVPHEVVGDALRLGQVLLNLCDNAIKFTERGHIEVTVQVMLALGKEVELLFSVGDTGAGIPTVKQKAIFELFTQADASTTRRHGGTGLGLTIAKKLVELMGGHLGVSSQVGSGSTFSFTARFGSVAPRTEDAAVAPADAEPPAQRYAALRGATVLLAEDNELNQLLARELLAQVGVETIVASNGREAIELLRAHPEVDLVLMDCQMPVMDGFAATRAIRADKKLPRVPILAMTANVLPEDLASCRGAGMNDHIGKPIDVDELYSVLQQWLHRTLEAVTESRPVPLNALR